MQELLASQEGAYVVQSALTCASIQEVMQVFKIVLPHAHAVSTHPKGIFALKHLMEVIRDRVVQSNSRWVGQMALQM